VRVGYTNANRNPTSASPIHQAEERLDVIRRETAELQRDTKRLQGDAEVERIAREQYGLVRPGETSYVIVPETTPTTAAP
jgi:cell division protein FtsB